MQPTWCQLILTVIPIANGNQNYEALAYTAVCAHLFSKVGRAVGVSEFYTNNFTLVKMEQQKISHQKLLATPLTLTMSAHAHPYLKYSKVISSPFIS